MEEKMKVRYIGKSFGVTGLTNGRIYECTEITEDGLLRIIDDEGPDEDEEYLPGYLYSATNPAPIDGSSSGGKWEIIEDDERGSLKKAICNRRGDSEIDRFRKLYR